MIARRIEYSLKAAALLLGGIGLNLLLRPEGFYQSYGIAVEQTALFNELRAAGGGLVGIAAYLLFTVHTLNDYQKAVQLTMSLFLGYGLARCLSLLLDGMPPDGLLQALGIEMAIGLGFGLWLLRQKATP